MSALVDIWTTEYAKLRENGQTLFSSGSGPFAAECSQVVLKNSTEVARAFVSRVKGVKLNVLACSEGSVSMLVQCFSP